MNPGCMASGKPCSILSCVTHCLPLPGPALHCTHPLWALAQAAHHSQMQTPQVSAEQASQQASGQQFLTKLSPPELPVGISSR